LVKVHVLSEHITSTDQRVSTLDNFLIKAFFFTNLLTHNHNEIVTTAGNHSGIAATDNATAAKNASCTQVVPNSTLVINIPTHIIKITTQIHLLNLSKSFCKCVCFSGASCIIQAIFHISVCIPIAVTIALPRPLVTTVVANTIFF
jgi:hypothetical protein